MFTPFPVLAKVLDDLLESMLDSWVFGERQAEYGIGGYVPEVKASGPLRPGDQRKAIAYLEHRCHHRGGLETLFLFASSTWCSV